MSEEHAVATFVVVSDFLLYCLFSLRDIPTVVGGVENLPSALQKLPAVFDLKRSMQPGRALAHYFGWTAFLQFVPVVAAVADGTSTIPGTVAIFELVAASGWTGYLLLSSRRRHWRPGSN